jgi:hypothetical protein
VAAGLVASGPVVGCIWNWVMWMFVSVFAARAAEVSAAIDTSNRTRSFKARDIAANPRAT